MSFALLSSILLFSSCVVLAKPARFEVKDAAFRNLVQWVSDAPLEKIVASSHFVTGWVELDPQNLKSGVKGEFEVDVRAFEMGPESRQAKLRETLLAAQEYPGAFYKIDRLVDATLHDLTAGKAVSARVTGTLTARGVSRRQEMFVKATYYPESEWTRRRMTGNLLKVSASCDLTLLDFKFAIPEVLNGLLAPVIRFSADGVATDQLPVPARMESLDKGQGAG